jgi:hypothetical protein
MSLRKKHSPDGAVFRRFDRRHNQTLLEAIGNPRRDAHDAPLAAQAAGQRAEYKAWEPRTRSSCAARPAYVLPLLVKPGHQCCCPARYGPAHRLGWSAWRRSHQARSRASHYRESVTEHFSFHPGHRSWSPEPKGEGFIGR